jgi:ketosteroid isomerase-like protein
MRKIILTLALCLCIAAPAAASDPSDALGRVRQFIDAFNKGDAKAAVAICADSASVIDDFAPYTWQGAGACERWAGDFDADARNNGIEPLKVTLGKPRHVDVAGDHAYVVVPAWSGAKP